MSNSAPTSPMIRFHYVPSNGTEGELFFAQCNGCRHDLRENHDTNLCAIGIGSRVFEGGWCERGQEPWFDPTELDQHTLIVGPARCLKRVAVDAIRDVSGQMPLFDAPLPTR